MLYVKQPLSIDIYVRKWYNSVDKISLVFYHRISLIILSTLTYYTGANLH